MRRGSAWEFELERHHVRYLRDGLAWVGKTFPGAKLWENRLVYEEKGMPDFVGVAAGGRAVVFDAKESHVDRLPFSNIAQHQAVSLRRCHAMGGVAFLAVKLPSGKYILPWENIADAYFTWLEAPKDRTRQASAKPEDMLPMPPDGWITYARAVEVR